ncbi:MAG: hypothetical protein JWO94_3393 [Verrucomicrobiaceae bacterium]|nr:hypothetical protein [Verrucomicrobiaceae bacterium]
MKTTSASSALRTAFAAAALLPALHAGFSLAGTPVDAAKAVQPAAATEESEFDKIWSLATLYKNPSNPWIEEVRLFGRFHENWADEQTNRGDWEGFEARRVRAGIDIKFLDGFELRGEYRFIPSQYPIKATQGLTDANLSWSIDPAFKITVGKQLPPFTDEGIITSNELLTVERSNVANTFWTGEDNYSTGVSISGTKNAWQYYAGVFSGELDPYFSKFDAGYYYVGGLGYDFARQLKVDHALLRVDYVYNDGNPLNLAPKPFSNTVDLDFELKQGRYGLNGTVIRGSGIGKQPDVWGLEIMPTFSITKKLEFVTRYTFLDSDGAGGIKPERRYENEVPDINGTRGDRYQAVYAGLNYYIYGHKLKLQTGIEYSTMHDSSGKGGAFEAWSYQSGFRLSF